MDNPNALVNFILNSLLDEDLPLLSADEYSDGADTDENEQ